MAVNDHIVRLVAPLIAAPRSAAVLLDLDGTLAPIVPDPAAVRIPQATRQALDRIARRYGLLAFVSGRSLRDLRRIVGMDGVAYAGNHGLEVRDADGRSLPVPGVDLAALRRFATRWDPDELVRHGVWLEDKHATLTFHYRTAPDPHHAARMLDADVAPAGRQAGLRVEPGRMSLEVHPAGAADKGTAAAALLDAHPSLDGALSMGDDRTDTTVWNMLGRRLADGRLRAAVTVGVASDETPDVVTRSAGAMVAGIDGAAAVLAALAG